jgi:dephospho-CoA kinase
VYVVAVTGGLGAGKSEASRFFESRGAHVVDLDELAKGLLETDSHVRDALVAAFGEDIVGDTGAISTNRLAEQAFSCDANAETLSALVHPGVVERVEQELQDLALQARPPSVVVLEIPLLAEVPVLRDVADLVVAIEAPEPLRVARAVERGMSEDDARTRIARQADDEARARIADVVVANDGTPEDFRARLEALWSEHLVRRGPGERE